MKLEDVKNYFGSEMEALKKGGFSATTWGGWKQMGYIPFHHQHLFEKISNGTLTANLSHTNYKKKPKKVCQKCYSLLSQ